jgi:hypothetical protein
VTSIALRNEFLEPNGFYLECHGCEGDKEYALIPWQL